jgi:Tfp pilus assembly PilM family ATPase
MHKRERNIFRLLMSDFAIFIFFVFVVSDLINMHMRLIFHIDLFASQNILSTAVKKAKDNKSKTKILEFDILYTNKTASFSYSNNIHFIRKIYFVNKKIDFQNNPKFNFSLRAPPSFV